MVIAYIIFGVVLLSLILYYPWYITFYTDNGLKCDVLVYGFMRFPIDLSKRLNEISEIIEKIKKVKSAGASNDDIWEKATMVHLFWYMAVPMDMPVMGLALLPIFATVQTVILDNILAPFKKVRNVDTGTLYNYIDNDIYIYFDCIIRINLVKIISVSIKSLLKITEKQKNIEVN